MPEGTHYVVSNKTRGGWDIKRGNAKRSIKHFDSKKDAVAYAREISENQNTRLVVKKS